MTRRAVAALLLLATVVAGVGCSTGDEPAARAPRAPSGPPATGGTEEAVAGGAVELSGTPGDLTTDVAATTRSLREHWTQQLAATYDRTSTPLARP